MPPRRAAVHSLVRHLLRPSLHFEKKRNRCVWPIRVCGFFWHSHSTRSCEVWGSKLGNKGSIRAKYSSEKPRTKASISFSVRQRPKSIQQTRRSVGSVGKVSGYGGFTVSRSQTPKPSEANGNNSKRFKLSIAVFSPPSRSFLAVQIRAAHSHTQCTLPHIPESWPLHGIDSHSQTSEIPPSSRPVLRGF